MQNIKLCGLEPCEEVLGLRSPCHTVGMAQPATGLDSLSLPSLNLSSLIIKGVAGHPPMDALGRGPLQWLKAVHLGSWVKGHSLIFCSVARACRGGAGKGEHKHDVSALVEPRKPHPISWWRKKMEKMAPCRSFNVPGKFYHFLFFFLKVRVKYFY